MTDVELLLKQIIGAGSPLPTDAGARVYPVRAPQGVDAPYIVYQRISSVPAASLGVAAGPDLVRVQIDVWAPTYAEAKTIAGQVRAAMDAATESAVLKSRFDNGFDDFEIELGLYRASADYMCWQK